MSNSFDIFEDFDDSIYFEPPDHISLIASLTEEERCGSYDDWKSFYEECVNFE